MNDFVLHHDALRLARYSLPDEAIGKARYFFRQSIGEATWTVRTASDALIAVFSNRRIVGKMTRKAHNDISRETKVVDVVEFDATEAVLSMPLEDVLYLRDNTRESDELGQQIIDWTGPCDVAIESSICAFFDINDLSEITPEAWAFLQRERRGRE